MPGTGDSADRLFSLLKKQYTEKGRHYHNLEHLEAMFRLFDAHRPHLQDPDTVALAIFFHDVVYRASRKDNEEKSAVWAAKKLTEPGYPKGRIDRVCAFILATKTHTMPPGAPADLAFLLDFDLAILGAPWADYEWYAQKIRREYSIYPDLLYRPGRRKALEHFLERPFIFQTDTFRAAFEQTAIANLRREIELLSA